MPQSPDQDHMGLGFRSPSDPVNRSLYADLSPETEQHYVNNMPRPAGVNAARRGQDARPSAAPNPLFSAVAPRNERTNPRNDVENMRPAVGNGIPPLNNMRTRRPAAELADQRTAQVLGYLESDDPLSDVSETQSQSQPDHGDSSDDDDPPNLQSKEYILTGNANKAKNEKFRRVKAAPWMKAITPLDQSPGWIDCVLVTDGLPVPAGSSWPLPLNGERNYVTWTGMVKDLQLELSDQVTFQEARNSEGVTYARIYVTKHRPSLITPVDQVARAPVPIVDTAQGANTSAAHAAEAAAGACPSGTAPAGKKRAFRTMVPSRRHQVESPAQNNQVEATAAAEHPAPVGVAPVIAPFSPPSSSVPTHNPPAAAAAAAGPSSKRKLTDNPWFQHFQGVINILTRHGVSKPTIKAFNYEFPHISPEDSRFLYESLVLIDEDGNSERVRQFADQWATVLEGL
ncbi:hypothetical protein NADE_005973 [Nannochloris sp. 'desiccata']|nr:hypothetical protein NADE_005973 [Chlorella desiccata (nom. nud.)]